MINIPFIEEFGKAFFPKKFRPKVRSHMESAGVYKSPYSIIGLLFYLSLILTAFVMFIYIYPRIIVLVDVSSVNNFLGSLIVGISVFFSWALTQMIIMLFLLSLLYFVLDMKIYYRIKDIEKNLNGFLNLVSTNLKAGMNLDKAFFSAVKPKFGVLAEEITLVSKKVMTGQDLHSALKELAEKYNSPELKRNLNIVISEIEVGGKVSKIIDDVVEYSKNAHKLKRQMIASITGYVIYISAIVLFMAPVLFALSYNLISFLSSLLGQIGGSLNTSGLPSFLSNFSAEGLNPDLFRTFGYYAIGVISFVSSLIISLIVKGDIKGGIKYTPVYLVVSLFSYHVSLLFLGTLFGGLTI
ncbi:MAG: type II secretion system F family protein [Nanobdellota archaeon]